MAKSSDKNSKDSKSDLSNLTWEFSIVEARKLSEARAWKVTFASMILAFGCVVALALSMPLRQTVTRIVEVDKLTGETGVISDLPAYTSSRNDINDKHWLKKFVISYERYDFKILQNDFDTIKILSELKTYNKYKERFSGSDSLHLKLADTVEIIPTILSITIPSKGIATVRYEVVTSSTKGTTKPITLRYIATIGYLYKPNTFAKEKDLIDNPLGFYVTSIQIDPEVVTTTDRVNDVPTPLTEEVEQESEIAPKANEEKPTKRPIRGDGTGLKMSPTVPAIGDQS